MRVLKLEQSGMQNTASMSNLATQNNMQAINGMQKSDSVAFGKSFTAAQLTKCAEKIKGAHNASLVGYGVTAFAAAFTGGLSLPFGALCGAKCRDDLQFDLAKILELTDDERTKIMAKISPRFSEDAVGASITKLGETFNLRQLGESFIAEAKRLR